MVAICCHPMIIVPRQHGFMPRCIDLKHDGSDCAYIFFQRETIIGVFLYLKQKMNWGIEHLEIKIFHNVVCKLFKDINFHYIYNFLFVSIYVVSKLYSIADEICKL
jgi:hypothetical protein